MIVLYICNMVLILISFKIKTENNLDRLKNTNIIILRYISTSIYCLYVIYEFTINNVCIAHYYFFFLSVWIVLCKEVVARFRYFAGITCYFLVFLRWISISNHTCITHVYPCKCLENFCIWTYILNNSRNILNGWSKCGVIN